MAVTSSAPISITDISDEFGGDLPDSLTEYYRGGGLVPDTTANASVPTSGAISLTDFFGSSSVTAWSTTMTVGGFTSKLSEYGYGSAGAVQNEAPTYGSVSDNTVDILGGAFFRQCKWSSVSGGVIYLEIDGGSTSWSTIVINGTTFTRTNMTKDVDLWYQGTGISNPFPSIDSTCTITMNP
tara:strand:+ start:7 stop:552 length:546 start_codon:yes stop_codon:yes gene_type:complete